MCTESTESEQKLRQLLEALNQGVIYQNADGAIVEANSAAEKILGLSRNQIMGKTSLDPSWRCITSDGSLLAGEQHPAMVALRTGQPVTDFLMGVFHSPLQQYRWLQVSAAPQFQPDSSSPYQVIVTFSDISERKNAEDALRESELQYHHLFDTMQEGFAIHEVVFDDSGRPCDYRYIDINPAFERLTGLTRAQVIGRTVREVLPRIEESWIETYCRVAITGEPVEIENYVLELDSYYRAKAFSPELNKFVVVFENITEQKKSLLELTTREEQQRVLFQASLAGILMVDPSGTILLANTRMAEMLGYELSEFIGTRYPDHVHPDQRNTGDERMRKLINREIDFVSTERHFIRKDGSGFWGYLSGRRHEDANGNLISLIGHISDITELKEAQESIRESEQRYRAIIEDLQDVYYRSDAEGRLTMVNPAGVTLFGYDSTEEILGSIVRDTFYYEPEERDAFVHNLKIKGRLYNYEVTLKKRDGTPIPVTTSSHLMFNADGSYAGVEGTFRDVTEVKAIEQERQALEKQLLHAQKLESLGVLAGGIAHDFNNILMAILGNADLALMRINPESPAVENLHRIERAAARAADLAKQMLAYSGKGIFVIEQLDLNRLLEEMLHMLEVSITKSAILRLNPHIPLPAVAADATQIRQIIMNLVINASEALGDKSGVIAITTGCMQCDRSYLKDVWLDENINEGLYVYLEIADTGCGMNRDTLSKLFDPFFTTKFTGRGLGMAAALGIVRGHKGAIKVYSEPGTGSTFKVLFPASGLPTELFNGTTDHDQWQGSGTVLLVDDEETVRGIGTEMLKELGFTVITANDGREALEAFRQNPAISFVLLDLTMPHMDGEQCFRELRMLKPEIQVIISSGYNEQEVTQKFVGKGLAGFIQKPYKLSLLRDTIKNMAH
jgi:PAS domain S-box-containing protein